MNGLAWRLRTPHWRSGCSAGVQLQPLVDDMRDELLTALFAVLQQPLEHVL